VKRTTACLLLLAAWANGFSQELSLKGTPFRRSDLKIIWNIATNTLPAAVWVYRVLPNRFSPAVISNLLAICSLTEKEKTREDNDWLVFQSRDDSRRRLGLLFPLGSIEYDAQPRHGPTNLVMQVPTEAQALELATKIFPELGIDLTDIERKENGSPNLHVFDSETTYFVNNTAVTNTEFRGVRFRRAVDGALVVGAGVGGNCEIRFGDHGKVSKLSVSWRNLQRQNRYELDPPEVLGQRIRDGKAVQGMLVMGAEPIDWKTVRRVTITSAKVCYNGGDTSRPSDWLIPFAALWATVDTGRGNVEVEIDCPAVGERR
jgi:hypothetical protein